MYELHKLIASQAAPSDEAVPARPVSRPQFASSDCGQSSFSASGVWIHLLLFLGTASTHTYSAVSLKLNLFNSSHNSCSSCPSPASTPASTSTSSLVLWATRFRGYTQPSSS